MKKTLSLLVSFSLACSTLSFSQLGWVLDNPTKHEFLHQLAQAESGHFALLHGNDSLCCSNSLTVLDGAGTAKFIYASTSFLDNTQVVQLKKIIEMPDATFSIVALVNTFDPVSGNGFTSDMIIEFDQSGNLEDFSYMATQSADIVVSLSDGSFVVIELSSSKVLRKFHDVLNLWSLTLTDYVVSDMVSSNNDSILFATEQGLLTLDKDGEFVSIYPEYLFHKIKMNEQAVVGSRTDSLFLLSTDYALISSVGFSGQTIKDYDLSSNTIAVLTSTDSIYLFDLELAQLNSFELGGNTSYKTVALSGTGVILGGSEVYGGTMPINTTHTVFLEEYSFAGEDYGFNNDVGVTAVEQSSETDVINNGQWGYEVIFKDVSIIVENFGDHSVESLYLRTTPFRSEKLEGVSLQPGGTVELVWEEIKRTFSTNPAGIDTELCIWTSHPDILLDTDASNDTYCTGFLVNGEETIPEKWLLNIYPNPTNDHLTIQLKDLNVGEKATFRISDVHGRTVEEFSANRNEETYTIPVWGWADGMYFVQYLEGGTLSSSGKFVVRR